MCNIGSGSNAEHGNQGSQTCLCGSVTPKRAGRRGSWVLLTWDPGPCGKGIEVRLIFLKAHPYNTNVHGATDVPGVHPCTDQPDSPRTRQISKPDGDSFRKKVTLEFENGDLTVMEY